MKSAYFTTSCQKLPAKHKLTNGNYSEPELTLLRLLSLSSANEKEVATSESMIAVLCPLVAKIQLKNAS